MKGKSSANKYYEGAKKGAKKGSSRPKSNQEKAKASATVPTDDFSWEAAAYSNGCAPVPSRPSNRHSIVYSQPNGHYQCFGQVGYPLLRFNTFTNSFELSYFSIFRLLPTKCLPQSTKISLDNTAAIKWTGNRLAQNFWVAYQT